MLKLIGLAGLCGILAVGCSALDTSTFQNNYSLYNREAMKAEKENNWPAAAKRYFLALQNAEWAKEGKGVRSEFHYKLGRALGVTCQFDDSQVQLTQAYALNPRLPQALVELGRLQLSQNKFSDALGNFDRAIPELEKYAVGSTDPIGYADMLDDFQAAFAKTNRAADAAKAHDKATKLRGAHPGKSPLISRAPYATQCPAAKSQ